MHVLPNKVDFYITNVCNLTCQNCNRFNNFDFRGWQRWSDYQDQYEQWGKLVKLTAVTIMGGEPFLNPTLIDWVKGVNRIFGIEVQILTNGTRFRHVPDLYDALFFDGTSALHNHIGVSLHRPGQFEKLKEDILYFLKGPVEIYPKGHKKNIWNSDYHFVDCNGIMVNVQIVDHFHSAAINHSWKVGPQIQKVFVLHNSDPKLAHENCGFAQFKSYHFIRGNLYKCAPVALLPEFDQQHQIHMSEQDRTLLNSYQPLSVGNFKKYHKKFFANLDQPIAQCKFCPEKYKFQTIFPVVKGSLKDLYNVQ
jgi:organic radical activating enzyme